MGPDDYDFGQLLGHGGFAKVFRCKNRETGESVAIKVIEKERLSADPSMIERISNEIRIHSRLSHPNIVEFKTCFQDESSIYIVLEPCSHGNLYRLFKTRTKLSESEVASIMNQLLSALEYLHAQGIVHRDLKLSNIVLNEKLIVKLCDFGLAVQMEHPDEEHFTICGTPNYIAPEVASQRAHGTPADLWSVGCLFYSLVTGSMPFEHAGGVRDTLQTIIAGEYEKPSGVSDDGINFLRCLLDMDPRRRETARTMLNHSFLRRHCPRINSKITVKSVSHGWEQLAAPETPETSVESESEQLLIPKKSEEPSDFHLSSKKALSQLLCTESGVALYSSDEFRDGFALRNASTSITRSKHDDHIPPPKTQSSYLDSILKCRDSTSSALPSCGVLGRLSLQSTESVSHLTLPSLSLSMSMSADGAHLRTDASTHNCSYTSAAATESGLQSWVDDCLSPVIYCSKAADVLLVSPEGDVLFCTKANIKGGAFQILKGVGIESSFSNCTTTASSSSVSVSSVKLMRFCIRRETPNWLFVGDIDSGMAMEIRNIIQHRTDVNKKVCPADMKLFSSEGWLRQYSIADPDFPSTIQHLYRKVAEILQEMKARIPKLALYLSVKDTASTSIYCKCMLMSNGSLPDFRIQWVDKTKLRYSLRSGRLHISGSSIGTFQWDGVEGLSCSGAPDTVKDYLFIAQELMRRCIAAHNNNKTSGKGSLVWSRNRRSKQDGPILVFDEIDKLELDYLKFHR